MDVEAGPTTEIETMAMSSNGHTYEALGAPYSGFRETVPQDERVSRDRLLELTNMYFDGLERNDPDHDHSFIHPECVVESMAS